LKRAITSALMACLILASVLAISGVTAQPSEKVPVIVGFKDKPDLDLIRSYGGDIKCEYKLIPAVACSLPQQAIDALEKNPVIAYIEGDFEVYAIDTELDNSWGVKRIGAGVVHGYNKGTGVKVAIIDTGIDYAHPDLDANYMGGYDFVNNDADPKDDHGHGTHCAGIVAAEDNDIGVIGVAPKAYLYAVKVLNSKGSGYLSNVILGIQWSVNNGMQVVSMSLGTSTYSTSLKDACDKAYAAGLVLVAAAGNSGDGNPNTNEYSYPAAYDSVIAVGATDKSDTAPSWSNSGPYLELAAPGISIYSTLPTYGVTLSGTYGYDYGTLSGTSMACPHVAGTAALVIASDSTLTNVGVRTCLKTTADDLGAGGWDTVYGYGLVDADEVAPGVDTTPPMISILSPADGALINTASPRISATVTDASGIDTASIVMTVDGASVAHTYDSATGLVSYDVPATEPLAEGLHTVALDVSDTVGNPATASWSFTVDTTPPTHVTGVTVTTVSSSQLDISWTANTELDLDHYNVYRSTVSGGPYDLVASPTTNSYSDTGLTALTTYYYIVTAVDKAGNEGIPSSPEELGTTSEAPAQPTMHVASIVMSKGSRIAGRNTFVWAIAKVTIVDDKGVPVGGAAVYGHWEVSTTDSDSGITEASGQVSLTSNSVKNPPSGTTFVFVVDNVVLSGWTYDSSASVTRDSLTYVP